MNIDDPLLRALPTVEGYKLLPPCLVTGKLGGGGMGMVYRGYHTKLETDVAIKVLSPLVASQDERFVDRFQREARLAARIAPDNPNLIHVYDVAESFGLHYIVMELVRGETLRERVKRKGKLGEREALSILAGAANGLASAHTRGVVHRDVKPDNLMVTREGRVKVADLGLAKADATADQSMSVVMGTPKYMAPEHWTGMENVTPATDVWALGATLYFMLKGDDPFPGSSQGARFPDLKANLPGLSAPCRALLQRCVAADPAERPADAAVLLEAIREQWPERGEKLADADAGKGSMRATTINQPAPETVRAARQTLASPAADLSADARTVAPRRAQGDPRAPGRTAATAPGPRRRWGVLAGVGVVLAAALAFLPSLCGGGQSAAELLTRGKAQIQQKRTFDAGVATLEEARRLDNDNPAITIELVGAYAARARLPETELSRALKDAKAAAELDNRPEIASLLEETKSRVRARLDGMVLSPLPKTVVGRQVDVTVQMKDEDAGLVESVRIKGDSASLRLGTAASKVTFASDGPQTIEVVVVGPADLQVTRSIEVIVDSEPPALFITSPNDDSVVGSRVTIVGTVSDAASVTLKLTATGTERSDVPVDNGEFRVDLVVPAAGKNFEVTLEATDAGGRTSQAKRTLRVDTSLPEITLGEFSLRTKQASLVVSVQVSDAKSVVIGGEAAKQVGSSWQRPVPLVEGDNNVKIEAIGRNGASASQSVTLVRDSKPPTFEGLPRSVTAGTTVELRGTLSERAELTVDDDRVAVVDLAFTQRVTLDTARTAPIRLVARDDVGNEGVEEVRVQAPLVRQAQVIPGWRYEVVVGALGVQSDYPRSVRDVRSGIVFVLLEPGEFVMGAQSTKTDEGPPRRVRITRPFYLATTETTRAQWRRVAGDESGRGAGDDHPVVSVSWDQAKAWLRRLNDGGEAFALPTEAEWEFACRAGTTTDYAFGDRLTADDANIGGAGTVVVGSRRANAWGLFDMHGNVAEWCEDVYDKAYYKDAPTDDPTGPRTVGDRVLRGGSYQSLQAFWRSAARNSAKANLTDKLIGFRVARRL